jgi:hypothetical protein
VGAVVEEEEEEEELVVKSRRGTSLGFCSEDVESAFNYAGVPTSHPNGSESILILYSIIRPIFITQIMPLCLVYEIYNKVVI